MSDERASDPTERSGRDASSGSTTPGSGDRDVDVATVVTYLQWGGLVALAVLTLVAGVGIYTSITAIIDVWVTDYYQPIARAAFNLAVLCVAVAAMFALLRRV